MLKKFLNSFILISIVFTIFANFVNFTNTASYSDISDNQNNYSSFFVSNSNDLFWPTPRLSHNYFSIWK